ncbi:MAG: 16S rRNA (cytosine(1402)-N(4))-methyltransferase [Epsilonproteobacteria bacterium]|nr:16S rRNA (cytosine(1402)-N(4))-methyltransferase [Campylobacterota bacterium]NPA63481.1 16S rRNA (cytosine(1402)-N(4))-methyltransferase RsmH [Campylobacterota bacterium]
MERPHIPVLKDEVVDLFADKEGYIIDATLGYGGHSEALLKSSDKIKILGIDQDKEAIAFSKKILAPFQDRVQIYQGRFSQIVPSLLEEYPVVGVLADIGVSSLQLDKKERGFGFESQRLDMRMDQDGELSAFDVVNHYDEERLAQILYDYGEIPQAKRLARAIVERRPIHTPKELKQIIESILPKKRRISPATTAFQAIRIEVNKELEELEGLLEALERARPKGAKVGIITFHSLEDRIVKNRFKKWAKECVCPPHAMRCECGADHALGRILTKKPIVATDEEIKINPRSRSAKLRAFEFKE